MAGGTEASNIDLAETAIRAVVLYSMMEFQGGNAKNIRVTKHGREFSISDDGRGHPIDKQVDGISYLRLIYTHFEYPFDVDGGVPVQLQGIGMSFVNAICSELLLTVRKTGETLVASFENGRFKSTDCKPSASSETGITVQGRVRPELSAGIADADRLEKWLVSLARAHPALRIQINGRELRG